MKNKEQKENRFTYSDDSGLKILSEQEILDSIGDKKEKKEDRQIKKSYESWL